MGAVRKIQTTKKTTAKKTKKKAARKSKTKLKILKEDACCAGCKIDGFIQDLLKSTHGHDSELGRRFQETLNEFNYEMEEQEDTGYVPC